VLHKLVKNGSVPHTNTTEREIFTDFVVYGFLSSRKKKKLKELQTGIGVAEVKTDSIIYIHPDFKSKRCPCCGKGQMTFYNRKN